MCMKTSSVQILIVELNLSHFFVARDFPLHLEVSLFSEIVRAGHLDGFSHSPRPWPGI